MKNLGLAIAGLVLMCGCGGGSGGGGIVTATTPPTPLISVSLSPSAQTDLDQGQSVKFTATVENDSSGKGVTWSMSGGGSGSLGTFSNMTATSVTFNAPATVSADLNVTVTATAVEDTAMASSAPVMITPPPTIVATPLVNPSPNTNYSANLQASGGVGALTWSLVAGALPTSLSLSNSGVISGVPTVPGNFSFTAQVADSSTAAGGPDTAQAQFSLTVVTPIVMDTTALPTGSLGTTYLAAIGVTGGTPPYTWSVASGALPAALTLQPGSGVISGTPTAQGNTVFTVAVQDSSPTKQTQTAALAIAIGAPGALVITTTALLDGIVNAPYTGSVAATGGVPPYTWKIAAGELPTGVSLNTTTGAITGTPTSTGTATFTVAVLDFASPPDSQTQSLTIAVDSAPEACSSSGNNAELSGQYAFSLSGFNNGGFLTVVGSFTADGSGKITAGGADTNGFMGPQHSAINASASSYSVGSDGRGCATVSTVFGTFVTRFALGAVSSNIATAGHLIEWGSPSVSAFVGSGQLLRQTPSAFNGGMSGGYTFRAVGWDSTALGGRDVCIGAISAAGSTLNGLEEDCNDAWVVSTLQSPDLAGTYTSFDANGRGTAIIALGDSNFNFTFYAVSGSKLLAVNADPGAAMRGEWDQQIAPASGFTSASLSGNIVFYLNGVSLSDTASAVSMETAAADGVSSIAISYYENRAGTLQLPGTFTCSYVVQPNGRAALSSSTQSCGGTPPVLYLSSLNTGFILSASPGVDTGSFEPQSAGLFSNSTLSGSFFGGTAEVVISSAQPEVNAVTLNGNGIASGVVDISSDGSQDTGLPFLPSSIAVNPDGSFVVNTSNGAVAGVIISPTKFVMFSPETATTPYPTLLVMQQ